MTATAIQAVLAVIQGFLSVLGTSNATTGLISNIITALSQMMPYIVSEIETVGVAVKNIIAQLQNEGNPTQEQLNDLDNLTAQVDAAWAKDLDKFDPDNPANAGTPAGDDPEAA